MKKNLMTTTATILTSAMVIISATPFTSFAAVNTTAKPKTTTNVTATAPAAKTTGTTANASVGITKEEALQAALDHAGYKKADVKFPSVKKDIEDGQEVWEVKFYVGFYEYDYDIAVSDGQILEFDIDD